MSSSDDDDGDILYYRVAAAIADGVYGYPTVLSLLQGLPATDDLMPAARAADNDAVEAALTLPPGDVKAAANAAYVDWEDKMHPSPATQFAYETAARRALVETKNATLAAVCYSNLSQLHLAAEQWEQAFIAAALAIAHAPTGPSISKAYYRLVAAGLHIHELHENRNKILKSVCILAVQRGGCGAVAEFLDLQGEVFGKIEGVFVPAGNRGGWRTRSFQYGDPVLRNAHKCPWMNAIGFPICMVRMGCRATGAAADNVVGTWAMIDVETGWAPREFQRQVGDVFFFRSDGEPVDIRLVTHMHNYHSQLLDKFSMLIKPEVSTKDFFQFVRRAEENATKNSASS
eukprot:CAMPEP_0174837994 /NCGR_PEP_ID=MMETSP1114-20130205/7122_1 /TAXON_ID=312471 /ORGANISM="Neobodo designis, Strain CCAP 1951/1" /LENGTH=343 /DNA_ID=CAMNT_0016072083 /DNA_START=40 /DNA_END=1071 /DNA_ORIENTATION=+